MGLWNWISAKASEVVAAVSGSPAQTPPVDSPSRQSQVVALVRYQNG